MRRNLPGLHLALPTLACAPPPPHPPPHRRRARGPLRSPEVRMSELSVGEERGLSGLSLDGQVRRAFFSLPPETMVDLVGRVRQGALERQLVYFRQGVAEVIPVMLRPFGIMPDQLAYLHFVSLTLINALKRLPDLYIQDFGVRALVPLTPPEHHFLWY